MDTSTLMFLFVLGGGAVINLFLLSVTTWMVLARIGEVEQELAEQKAATRAVMGMVQRLGKLQTVLLQELVPGAAEQLQGSGKGPAEGEPAGAQSAMVQQVMNLSDEQIALLPPDQKEQVLAIRAQVLASEAEAGAEAEEDRPSTSAPPEQSAPQAQSAMVQKIMKLSDEQIDLLPPDQKEQVLAIRAQVLASEAEAEASSAPPKSAEEKKAD